jgi:hypothetical protein
MPCFPTPGSVLQFQVLQHKHTPQRARALRIAALLWIRRCSLSPTHLSRACTLALALSRASFALSPHHTKSSAIMPPP